MDLGLSKGGKSIGRGWGALIAFATIAVAIGIYIFLSPQQDGLRGRILRLIEGQEDRARKPIGVIIREIDQGDESQKAQAITLLRNDLKGADLAQVLPHLLRALQDESEVVRNLAATVVGGLSQHF